MRANLSHRGAMVMLTPSHAWLHDFNATLLGPPCRLSKSNVCQHSFAIGAHHASIRGVMDDLTLSAGVDPAGCDGRVLSTKRLRSDIVWGKFL